MADSDLLALIRRKLNITWTDPGTENRLDDIMGDAVPTVCGMVGLRYDYDDETAYSANGAAFDFLAPSLDRSILLNWCLYEWNHKADLFRDAYKEEIDACRRRHLLETEEAANANADESV